MPHISPEDINRIADFESYRRDHGSYPESKSEATLIDHLDFSGLRVRQTVETVLRSKSLGCAPKVRPRDKVVLRKQRIASCKAPRHCCRVPPVGEAEAGSAGEQPAKE